MYAFRLPGGQEKTRHGAVLLEGTQELLDSFRSTHPRQLTDRKYAILAARIDSEQDSCWFISAANGKLVGYCHVSWSDTVNGRINHKVKVEPNQAYFFDSYVVRQDRHKGFHTFAIRERLRLMAERGVEEGITTISDKNAASLRSYRRFDPQPVLRLVYLPPLGRTITRKAR